MYHGQVLSVYNFAFNDQPVFRGLYHQSRVNHALTATINSRRYHRIRLFAANFCSLFICFLMIGCGPVLPP